MRAIDDEAVRDRVAAGDVGAAGTLDLTDEESKLWRGAADNYPDVTGFAFDAFLQFGEMKVEPPDAYNQAANYVQIRLKL